MRNLENQLNTIDPQLLGQRLQETRNQAGFTQQEVAQVLGVSRPTLVAIEKGQRKVTKKELVQLAYHYKVDVADLIAIPLEGTDLLVQFRTLVEQDLGFSGARDELDEAIHRLQQYAIKQLELERLLGKTRTFKPAVQYTIKGVRDLDGFAEEVAEEERSRLKLGDEPIPHFRDLIEDSIGLRIFLYPIRPKTSGLYGYAPELGGCIGLNIDHLPERRLYTLVHEYAHIITSPFSYRIQEVTQNPKSTPEERFARKFTSCFILPDSRVRKVLHESMEENNSDELDITELVGLSLKLKVSFEAFLRRLVELKYLTSGEVNRILNQRSVKRNKQSLGVSEPDLSEFEKKLLVYPESYYKHLVEAHDREILDQDECRSYLNVIQYQNKPLNFNVADLYRLISRYRNPQFMDENGNIDTFDLTSRQRIHIKR